MSGIISDNIGRSSGLIKSGGATSDYVLLSSYTADGDITADDDFTTDYSHYYVTYIHMNSEDADKDFHLRWRRDGADSDDSNYRSVVYGVGTQSGSATSLVTTYSWDAAEAKISGAGGSMEDFRRRGGLNGHMWITAPTDTSYYKSAMGQHWHWVDQGGSPGTPIIHTNWMMIENGVYTAITGFKLFVDGFNVNAGVVNVYGVKGSYPVIT